MRRPACCSQLMTSMQLMNTVHAGRLGGMRELHDVDWNLWLVLDAVLETGSVTEASRRLRRTQ